MQTAQNVSRFTGLFVIEMKSQIYQGIISQQNMGLAVGILVPLQVLILLTSQVKGTKSQLTVHVYPYPVTYTLIWHQRHYFYPH